VTVHQEAPTRQPGVADVTRGRALLWLASIGLGALVVSLAQSLLIPVLPTLPTKLHASSEAVQWLLTSTLLVSAVAVPLMGRLGDMFGKRLLLLVALSAMVVGSLLAAVSDDLPILILGRAIQGISSSAIPLGISLLATLLPKERRASSMALISAMLGVGGALGLPFAGLVAEHGDFHLLFWITATAAAVALVAILVLVPESQDRGGGRVDVVGALLIAAALVALLLPLSEGSAWGWGSPGVIALFVAAVVLFVLFGFWERRSRSPLVDLQSLLRRPILLTNIASLFIGFALFASLIGTATYVESPAETGYGFGASTLVAGLTMLPSGICMLVLSPVAARLINGIGAHRTLAIGGAIIAVGWIERILVTGSLWEVVLGSTIVGMGTGIGYASVPALVSAYTPGNELGSANGLNTLVRSLGSSLASAIGGSILASITITVGDSAFPSLAGYRVLFIICAAAAVLAAVIALNVPGRRVAAN
jgi:MFS family permease